MNTPSVAIPLRKKYEDWLRDSKGIASASCYFLQDIDMRTGLRYFEEVANLLIIGDVTFAYTILDEWGNEIREGGKSKTNSNRKSYFNKIYEFFISNEASCLPKNGMQIASNTLTNDELNKIRKKYNSVKLSQLDGMDTLLRAIGEQDFIKLSIESSFFLDTGIVEARFDEIAKIYKDRGCLPARNWKCSNVNADYGLPSDLEVFKDGNGNTEVCRIIKEATGFTLNAKLDSKSFINNIISHVWGNATHPLYFTSLWNIVLIPAWANHLMDKPFINDLSLVTKLQATFRAICLKLYNMMKFDWNAINMQCPKVGSSEGIQHGQYTIKLICKGDGKKPKAGLIKTCDVKI